MVLANVGTTLVVLSSVKIELQADKGGASQLLTEWAQAAPPFGGGGAAAAAEEAILPPGRERLVAASFDVRELGPCTLTCSAVFKGARVCPRMY